VQGVTDRIFAFRISILHWRPGELTILRGAVEAPRRYIYIYMGEGSPEFESKNGIWGFEPSGIV
jgi:hypothetical protein